jgi:L-seryl-tRNA(Ser) seleniumtransferase
MVVVTDKCHVNRCQQRADCSESRQEGSGRPEAGELRPLPSNRLRETPTTVQIAADDILEIAMERGGVREPPMVPYEACAALSMLLRRDYGMLMAHFVGVPPGTADLPIKFLRPETLERFGGAGKYAEAINNSLTRLGEVLQKPEDVRELPP